jgi:Tfp pilus assembly protein PilN
MEQLGTLKQRGDDLDLRLTTLSPLSDRVWSALTDPQSLADWMAALASNPTLADASTCYWMNLGQ